MKSLNERAWDELEKTIADADALQIAVEKKPGGTHVLDAGVSAPGGLEAGLAMARIGMSGLGTPTIELALVGNILWQWITVRSDHPLEACFLSQSAHWSVEIGSYRAMGSGPACLLNRSLKIGGTSEHQQVSDVAVLVLETAKLPDNETCIELAKQCEVDPKKFAIIVAPTSSLAGSVQIAARAIETGLHKLHHLGFDLQKIASGMGRCPIAAPTGSDYLSLGKTNDMVIFGSQVMLSIRGMPDAGLEEWTQRLPASTSPNYGEPFLETLRKAVHFYAIDSGLFAPAEVTLVSLDSGAAFHAGSIDQVQLTQVLGIK
jgi:methenyltetrahydromethanopterin cyclohydrolase